MRLAVPPPAARASHGLHACVPRRSTESRPSRPRGRAVWAAAVLHYKPPENFAGTVTFNARVSTASNAAQQADTGASCARVRQQLLATLPWGRRADAG